MYFYVQFVFYVYAKCQKAVLMQLWPNLADIIYCLLYEAVIFRANGYIVVHRLAMYGYLRDNAYFSYCPDLISCQLVGQVVYQTWEASVHRHILFRLIHHYHQHLNSPLHLTLWVSNNYLLNKAKCQDQEHYIWMIKLGSE